MFRPSIYFAVLVSLALCITFEAAHAQIQYILPSQINMQINSSAMFTVFAEEDIFDDNIIAINSPGFAEGTYSAILYSGETSVGIVFNSGPIPGDYPVYATLNGAPAMIAPVTLHLDPDNVDSDGDGLCDYDEDNIYGTDRLDPDTDNDLLLDGDDIAYPLDPLDADYDDDGIRDGQEIFDMLLPNNPDTDADALQDGMEIGLTSGVPAGMSDGLGIAYQGTNPGSFSPDTDPSTTTVPTDPDSDEDDLLDGQEDADADGFRDPAETDPNDSDSDDDTYPDGIEVAIGSDPLDPESTPLDITAPHLVGVTDMPNDQGRVLRLSWLRSQYDASDAPVVITGYGVYRRIDALAVSSSDKLAGWDSMGWIAAHGDSIYNFASPTTCDSTDVDICWSVFFVRATTVDPFLFYDSPPDSGYSVDNLAPTAPTNLVLAGTELSWDEAIENDFDYFSVYGSSVDVFDETAVIIDHTIGTTLDVSTHPYYYYHVTATDFAGNEGQAASTGGVSPVPAALPVHFALQDNVPNPFNPQTTIAFELPKRETVTLRVFDMSGRLVKELITTEPHTPGRHEVVWNGRDDNGRQVASGTYFYRLEAGSFSETKRMVLIK